MRVHFVKVGRGSKSWVADHPDPNFEWLEHQVKQGGKLMSNDIDFSEIDGNENHLGIFVGGFRHVGDIYLGIEPPQEIKEGVALQPITKQSTPAVQEGMRS
jgi:hypothetical protein